MNARSTSIRQLARVGAVAVLAAFALSGAMTSAKEDNTPHPAHIHSGTCDNLGDVVAPLADVAYPSGEASGPASAVPVALSDNSIDMPLQEIIDGGHAINVHKSADEIDTYIACGEIGGILTEREDGSGKELTMGLRELNDSGYAGVAWLSEENGKTLVSIELIETGGAGAGATAAEQPATAAANAESAAVEIKGFAFNPPTITVPVGGSITWTNADNTPHTATALDRSVLQSGAIKSGASFTQTFNTAGTFDYFCEFHPNMKGTIVVK
ncbi:MAG: cupredoxin family copper-binding protein [Thermomicrobiales bacterium]